MISIDTLQFLLQGIRAVGFLDAVAYMPFSIVFSVAGATRLFRHNPSSALKWFGASLIVVGLNYCIYIVYSYFAGVLNTLPLVDVWTVPLLGLGLALVASAKTENGQRY